MHRGLKGVRSESMVAIYLCSTGRLDRSSLSPVFLEYLRCEKSQDRCKFLLSGFLKGEVICNALMLPSFGSL